MRKNRLKKIIIAMCACVIFNSGTMIYANAKNNNLQNANELKNNYIIFEKIDSTGISDTVKNYMKTMWDAIDIYIDYIKTTNVDTLENSVLQIKNVVDISADCVKKAVAISSRQELAYIVIIIENIKNKLSLNNLNSLRNFMFKS